METKKLVSGYGPREPQVLAVFTRMVPGGQVSAQWFSQSWQNTITRRGLPQNEVKLDDPRFWDALDQAFLTSTTMKVVLE